jgi:hypothetical protein
MVTLGVSGRLEDASAAVVVKGRLEAAVTEAAVSRVPRVGYLATGGLPAAAIDACLRRAGATPRDVSQVVFVAEGTDPVASLTSSRPLVGDAELSLRLQAELAHAQRLTIAPSDAALELASALAPPAAKVVLLLDVRDGGGALVAPAQTGTMTLPLALGNWDAICAGGALLGRALGASDAGSAWALLDTLARDERETRPWEPALRRALTWDVNGGFAVDTTGLHRVIEDAQHSSPAPLAQHSEHLAAQSVRQGLASAFIGRVVEIVERIGDACRNGGEPLPVCTGSLMLLPSVRHRVRGLEPTPLPEPAGLGVGAALANANQPRAGAVEHLLVGPAFDETQIKSAIETARLDYVYEPDWGRLCARTSEMLAAGKLVGWFQGAAEFGPRSLGARSILADPSNRYTRDNVNHYLFRRPLATPLAVTLPAGATEAALGVRVDSPLAHRRVRFRRQPSAWCSVLERDQSLDVHTPDSSQGELLQLLEVHRQRTNVPGLVCVPLQSPGEPPACSPRDALRTVFCSPVDALVIGRFLVMKDYWLLRTLPT